MPPEGQPPSTDVAIMPASGEVVDLNDTRSVARAYRSLLDLDGAVRSAKGVLRDALAAQKALLGTGTIHVEGLGKVVVTTGTDKVYDAQAIKRELLEAGCPPETVREIVVETIDYKVNAVRAKQAAAANPVYAEIIERHRKEFPKTPVVTVP